MAWVQFPAGVRFFSSPVQTGSEAYPASDPRGTAEAVSPGVKRQGREADHSPPSNAEVKNGGAIPPLSHISSYHSA
jgi:hypothetical protein